MSPFSSSSPALPISWGLQPHRWATPECTKEIRDGGVAEPISSDSLPHCCLVAHPHWYHLGPNSGDRNSQHFRLCITSYKVQVCVCVCVCVCVFVCVWGVYDVSVCVRT